MPVATRDFQATYDGELVQIRAGQDWVCEGHELARLFPDSFAPDVSSHARRRSTARRAAVRSSRPRRASVLPQLRAAKRHTVTLDHWAYEAINREVGDGLESGGVLLGERADDGSFLVSDASGPGDSRRTASAITHDFDHYARFAEARSHAGARAFGLWHEHPSGSPEPSVTDLRAWRSLAERNRDGAFLAMIVTTPTNPSELRMRIHAWSVVDGVCEPCHVVTGVRRAAWR